jgi:hypothetical protein
VLVLVLVLVPVLVLALVLEALHQAVRACAWLG